MPRFLIASDAAWVRATLRGQLDSPDNEIIEVDRGTDALSAIREDPPDLAFLDLQIGNMGAAAVCREMREEAAAGRLAEVPVVILLDRAADSFVARRADADAWLLKPIPPRVLRRTVQTLLAGEPWTPEAADVDRERTTTVEESASVAFQPSPTD